jgi:hypothetical protein
MRVVCCAEGQYREVKQFMYSMGMPITERSPNPIRDFDQIAGCRDILFFLIIGHPEQPRADMMERLKAQGAEMVYIDDTWARARWRDQDRNFYDRERMKQAVYLNINPNSPALMDTTALHQLMESEFEKAEAKAKARAKAEAKVKADTPSKRRVPEGTRDLDLEDV